LLADRFVCRSRCVTLLRRGIRQVQKYHQDASKINIVAT
jgi:hypothetical protein